MNHCAPGPYSLHPFGRLAWPRSWSLTRIWVKKAASAVDREGWEPPGSGSRTGSGGAGHGPGSLSFSTQFPGLASVVGTLLHDRHPHSRVILASTILPPSMIDY